MGFEDIESAALNLDPYSRARLAEALLKSLDEGSGEELSEEECAQLWAAEAERRREECLSGKVKMIPFEQVMEDFSQLSPSLRGA